MTQSNTSAIIQKMIEDLFVVLVAGLVLSVTWNYIIPDLFNLPRLTYTEGVALYVVSNLLLKKD